MIQINILKTWDTKEASRRKTVGCQKGWIKMQETMSTIILAVFSLLTFVMLGIVVYILLADRKRKTDQKKLEEDTVEKLKDLSKETIQLNESIKQSAQNFTTTLQSQSKSFEERLQGQSKSFEERLQGQSKSFEERLQGQSELLKNYVEHTKALLNNTSEGFTENVQQTVKKVQQFKDKLELVHNTTFKETKGKVFS